MSFTSPELVRAHLNGLRAGTLPIAGIAVVLNGSSVVQLPHSGLAEESVVVKSPRQSEPVQERIALSADWLALTHAHLIERSVLLASDASLRALYVENIDYVADYTGGRVRRITTGSIPADVEVTMWYDYYHIYTEGDDYTVDHANGQLARQPGGLIADGQTVLVDYTVALSTISDAAIERAIAEAGDSVLAFLDSRYHHHPAPGIVIGETHWAIASICRARAAATLIDSAVSSAVVHNLARVWLDLAETYERSGRERLKRFGAPQASLRTAKRN